VEEIKFWEEHKEYQDTGRTFYVSGGFYNNGIMMYAIHIPWKGTCSILKVSVDSESAPIKFICKSIKECDNIIAQFLGYDDQMPLVKDYFGLQDVIE